MANGPAYVVSEASLERRLDDVRKSAAGSVHGLFGPSSISWRVNRESALFLAAGRAALLQLAHPWVAAAIAEHSTTLADPIGRFHRTFRVMFTMVFGSLGQALAASRGLHRRHSGIRGKLPEAVGLFAEGSCYEANEMAALRWVYATLVDSALVAYNLVLPSLNEAEREQFYHESQTMAALFGIPRNCLPANWMEFKAYFDSTCESNLLTVGPGACDMAHQLQRGRDHGCGRRSGIARSPHTCFHRAYERNFSSSIENVKSVLPFAQCAGCRRSIGACLIAFASLAPIRKRRPNSAENSALVCRCD